MALAPTLLLPLLDIQVSVGGQWSNAHLQDFGGGVLGTSYAAPLLSDFGALPAVHDTGSFATQVRRLGMCGYPWGPWLGALASPLSPTTC